MVNEPTTIAYAIKEALKPVFVDSGNLVMRECAKHLGMKFVEFAQAAFMSELTGFFIEYLADQLFTYFGGGGGDTDKSFDFRALLEELLLFLLRFFLILLLNRIFPNTVYLNTFLSIIVPRFLKYLIGELRRKS